MQPSLGRCRGPSRREGTKRFGRYGGRVEIVDLTALDGRGPAWGTASEELNATLLVWRAGEGQPEHVNEGRDVAVVELAGSGMLFVDGTEHVLAAGTLAIVPRGATRSMVDGA